MRVVPSRASLLAFLLASALMVSLVPAATAEIYFEEVTVDLGPQTIDAVLTGHQIQGSEARDLRLAVDQQYGNGDNEVTQDEVDAFVEARKKEFNDQLSFAGPMFFGSFQLRERSSITQEVTNMTFSESILGDVDSEETVVQAVEAKLTFASTQQSRVKVTFAEDFSAPFSQVGMSWGNATFQTVSPWAIDPETITPDGRENPFFEEGRFVVPYDQSSAFSSAERPLIFEIVDTDEQELESESEDSPPVALVVLLGALFSLVGLLKRRRAQ